MKNKTWLLPNVLKHTFHIQKALAWIRKTIVCDKCMYVCVHVGAWNECVRPVGCGGGVALCAKVNQSHSCGLVFCYVCVCAHCCCLYTLHYYIFMLDYSTEKTIWVKKQQQNFKTLELMVLQGVKNIVKKHSSGKTVFRLRNFTYQNNLDKSYSAGQGSTCN